MRAPVLLLHVVRKPTQLNVEGMVEFLRLRHPTRLKESVSQVSSVIVRALPAPWRCRGRAFRRVAVLSARSLLIPLVSLKTTP